MSLATISARTIQRSVSVSFILATLVVITLTLIPLNGSGPKIPYLDKIVHFFMFGGWSFLFGWVLTITYHSYRKKRRNYTHNSDFLTDYTTPIYLLLSVDLFSAVLSKFYRGFYQSVVHQI